MTGSGGHGQEVEPSRPAGARLASAFLIGLGLIAVLLLGAFYGIASYEWFGRLVVVPTSEAGFKGSSVMLVSFIVGVPLAIGILIGYVAGRRKLAGLTGSAGLSTLAICLCVFAAGALLREGTVCIAIVAPLLFVAAVVGALCGKLMASMRDSRGPKLLSVAMVLPLFLAPFEARLDSESTRLTVSRSVLIDAEPKRIWHLINYPLNIQPEELSGGFAYRIGVPYPLEARTIDERVGGKRQLRWQRGIQFQEVITAWEPEQHIAWRYEFGPKSFPAGSLDDHVVIGGRYFDLESTSYTLTQEADGTRLTIRVGLRVTTNFNWYAGFWADFLVRDTADAILNFYKVRSQA